MKKNLCMAISTYFLFSSFAFANGDTLQDVCYQSMIYTIAVQVGGNPISDAAREINVTGAFSSGKWLGIDKDSTERMIKMSGLNEDSKKFALQYQTDKSFAESFRNSFIAGCHKNPSDYSMN